MRASTLIGLMACLLVVAPLHAAPPNKAALVVSVLGGGKIVSSPSAINCPRACRHTFYRGALVRLTARPFKGWKFARWTGACRGSRGCLLRLLKRSNAVGAVFTALPPPPPPPPQPPAPPVQIVNFSVCPDTDSHPTGLVGVNGQPVPACNRDWSGAPFAPVHHVYCTGVVESGIGKQLDLTMTRNGILLFATAPTRINSFDWYFYVSYLIDPVIPSGDYVCQVKLDGQVVAARPFTVTP